MKSIFSISIVLIIFSLLTLTVYWLWQRQPKPKAQEPQTKIETVVKNEDDSKPKSFIILPEENTISPENTVEITAKTEPNVKIIFITNSKVSVENSQKDGTIIHKLELPDGLSLVQVIALNQKFEEAENTTLPVYVSKEESQKDKMFLSGTVNKIFGDTITLSSAQDNREITITTNTQKTIIPKPTTKKPAKDETDVRVGDYLVVIAQKAQTPTAEKIEIYREIKPRIEASWVVAKIASGAKSNIFSATNTKDNKLIEFSLNKNSQITENAKKAATSAIAKDKTAIIVYNPQNDNLTLLLHFL